MSWHAPSSPPQQDSHARTSVRSNRRLENKVCQQSSNYPRPGSCPLPASSRWNTQNHLNHLKRKKKKHTNVLFSMWNEICSSEKAQRQLGRIVFSSWTGLTGRWPSSLSDFRRSYRGNYSTDTHRLTHSLYQNRFLEAAFWKCDETINKLQCKVEQYNRLYPSSLEVCLL